MEVAKERWDMELHGSLLNHMTIITKVGVSYDDHMNADAPEVDSFSHGC